MKPDRLLDRALLPGRVLHPTYFAFCRSCQETTNHAGLGGPQGEEIGDACLWCGAMRPVQALPRKMARSASAAVPSKEDVA